MQTQGPKTGNENEPVTPIARQVIRFVLHLAAVYLVVNVCTYAFAAWIYRTLLFALQIHTNLSSFEFLYTHLLFLSCVPAFATGLVNARFRHRVAEFVWIVPTILLLYKLATFPATGSVLLESHSWPALHYYFGAGFLISEFHHWNEFTQLMSNPDMIRGIHQLRFTAPFYAGIAYSLAAALSRHNRPLQTALDRLRDSEGRYKMEMPTTTEEAINELPPARPRGLAR
jgi:hypothetical protein